MPIGTYHCLKGVLGQTAEGYYLLAETGGAWHLEVSVRATLLIDAGVIVEGYRSGFNSLDVRSIRPLQGSWEDIIFDMPWWERLLMRWGWVKER